MILLDGKLVSKKIQEEIVQEVGKIRPPRPPGIAFLLVGNNPASQSYIRAKKNRCREVGFASFDQELPAAITQKALISIIYELNNDPKIDGILLQLPLPEHLNSFHVLEAILPEKDIDGFHPVNMGKLLLGQSGGFWPCTPYGIVELLRYYQISLENKHVVIVGRSNIVGKPLAAICIQKQPGLNATVTIAHSGTPHLREVCQSADVLIVAVGHAHLIDKHMVKREAIVIDVGINRFNDGKLTGDVHFEEVASLAAAITPVPGGIGPMTIAMLLKNTWNACKHHLALC